MRETVAAIEAALAELEAARGELPDDLGAELGAIIERTRRVLEGIRGRTPAQTEA